MLKNTLLFLSLLLLAATVNFAQRHPKQMQKLEAQVRIEYANFVDENKSGRLADVVSYDDFTNYIRAGIKNKIISKYAGSEFLLRENSPYRFAVGSVTLDRDRKTGFYQPVIAEDVFAASYISSNDKEVTLSVRYNGSPQAITVAKNSVRVFALEWLDPRYRDSNIYVAVQLVEAKKMPTPCSIAEIGDDIINKSRPPKCYEAGSPELKP